MTELHVRLFGRFDFGASEPKPCRLEARKGQELFCFLLLNRRQWHHREFLASLLFAEYETERSKKLLRNALWHLQSSLDCIDNVCSSDILEVGPDWLQIRPEAPLNLDVALFEQAFGLVRGVPGETLDGVRVDALHSAVEIYQGELLEGWYQDWCLRDRERLHLMYLALLDKLMGFCEAHKAYEDAIHYGQSILQHDAARERTHQRLMRLYYLAGDRSTALRQWEQCEATLRQELDVAPSTRTRALYEQIRADRLAQDPLPAASPAYAASDPNNTPLPAMHDLLNRLEQFQAHMASFQHVFEQDISALRRAFDAA